jgi:hypothetical protein
MIKFVVFHIVTSPQDENSSQETHYQHHIQLAAILMTAVVGLLGISVEVCVEANAGSMQRACLL